MGAWSPAAVHRPALAWGADARASVRPRTDVPHCRASRARRAPGGQSVSSTDQLLEHHAAVWAGLRPRCLSRPPAQQAAALAYKDGASASTGSRPEGGDVDVLNEVGGVGATTEPPVPEPQNGCGAEAWLKVAKGAVR